MSVEVWLTLLRLSSQSNIDAVLNSGRASNKSLPLLATHRAFVVGCVGTITNVLKSGQPGVRVENDRVQKCVKLFEDVFHGNSY
jgi:hypothetical protein